ncbi:MAG: Dihydrolipoyl dehydrogenase [Chlamydiia bacterium]|nr:Dihydrolipoyl dehydrogenase [Chlamydiia bacterium]MCH9616268.1 Dihydrolipoyl dehydrogenase [Chlamydiia bacterium]MCH9629746.1 Dihydrolipoyl dehydrogenase [Chlamydiia bacterium]
MSSCYPYMQLLKGDIVAEKFDLVVIGAGPGGYVAAIKASQGGLKVALIEREFLGGTCLNVGCIPTKTLLANASALHKIKHAADYGISVGAVTIDYSKMKERKDGVVTTLRSSLEGLLKANGITIYEGTASFLSPNKIKVEGVVEIDTDKTIIATGSSPVDIPAFPCDHSRILNSTSILELTEVPKDLVVIGGGYIGCEFASLFAELGTKVTIVEALPAIVQAQGKDISDFLTKAFKAKGIEILTGVSVEKVDDKVHLNNGEALSCDKVLVSVGRRIHTDSLQLGNAGLTAGERGAIAVNAQMETEVSGIYAIGDVTGISMLAHVASHQGIIAASNACGEDAYMHYNAVPAVIFTHPEIATVGMLPEEAGPKAKVTRYPFKFHGKSLASNENDGFAQVVTDPESGLILGAQVIGEEASTLIAEMALAIANELTIECVFDTIHAHPTLPEAWMEASLIANNTPIHAPPTKRS